MVTTIQMLYVDCKKDQMTELIDALGIMKVDCSVEYEQYNNLHLIRSILVSGLSDKFTVDVLEDALEYLDYDHTIHEFGHTFPLISKLTLRKKGKEYKRCYSYAPAESTFDMRVVRFVKHQLPEERTADQVGTPFPAQLFCYYMSDGKVTKDDLKKFIEQTPGCEFKSIDKLDCYDYCNIQSGSPLVIAYCGQFLKSTIQ